jgi:hypothetical protein
MRQAARVPRRSGMPAGTTGARAPTDAAGSAPARSIKFSQVLPPAPMQLSHEAPPSWNCSNAALPARLRPCRICLAKATAQRPAPCAPVGHDDTIQNSSGTRVVTAGGQRMRRLSWRGDAALFVTGRGGLRRAQRLHTNARVPSSSATHARRNPDRSLAGGGGRQRCWVSKIGRRLVLFPGAAGLSGHLRG